MRFSRRRVLVVIVLISISIYLTLYTYEAHTVARYIGEASDGNVFWVNGPSGSLFPWPRRPGMLEILSGVNDVDVFIYKYLIKNWVLVGLSALLWIITILFVFKAAISGSSQETAKN